MFYCEPCRVERAWPKSLMQSLGPCELCSLESDCYDFPSSLLPPPKTPFPRKRAVVAGNE